LTLFRISSGVWWLPFLLWWCRLAAPLLSLCWRIRGQATRRPNSRATVEELELVGWHGGGSFFFSIGAPSSPQTNQNRLRWAAPLSSESDLLRLRCGWAAARRRFLSVRGTGWLVAAARGIPISSVTVAGPGLFSVQIGLLYEPSDVYLCI